MSVFKDGDIKICNICKCMTSSRSLCMRRKDAKYFATNKLFLEAFMNTYVIKIYKDKKIYLCKHCFYNINNLPSFSEILQRQLYGYL